MKSIQPICIFFNEFSTISFKLNNHYACMLSHYSCVQLFVTSWTVAHKAPQSMGFSREEYWSWLSFLSPGDLPDSGTGPTSLMSPALQADSLLIEPPRKPNNLYNTVFIEKFVPNSSLWHPLTVFLLSSYFLKC